MKQNRRLRSSISLAVALLVASVFSLSSLAAPDTSTISLSIDPQECTGTLTITNGTATINGNPVATGATVASGSAVTTGDGAVAIIDFGPAGRLRLNGSATPVCNNGQITVRLSCATERG